MLDELRAERLRDDVGGARERSVRVAALHLGQRQRPRPRVERVDDRVEHLVLDLDERRRLARGVARLGGDGGEDVADVGGLLALGDELAPVAGQRCPASARPERRRPSRRPRRPDDASAFETSMRTTRARGWSENRSAAVQHPRRRHVADVRLVAERELVARGSGRCATRRGRCLSTSGSGSPRRTAGGELDRVDDLDVAGAATEVAEQRARDLVARRLGVLGEQRPRPSSRSRASSSRTATRRRRRSSRPTSGASRPEAPPASRRACPRPASPSARTRRPARPSTSTVQAPQEPSGAQPSLTECTPKRLPQELEQALPPRAARP